MRPGRVLHSVGALLVHPRTHLLTEDLALHTNFQKGLKRTVAQPGISGRVRETGWVK